MKGWDWENGLSTPGHWFDEPGALIPMELSSLIVAIPQLVNFLVLEVGYQLKAVNPELDAA